MLFGSCLAQLSLYLHVTHVLYYLEGGKSLEESAREYQAIHSKKPELQEVEVLTGEENESNVLQVNTDHL